jgi:spore maturation protein CgeB
MPSDVRQMPDVLAANLAALRSAAPAVAEAVGSAPPLLQAELLATRSGMPTLSLEGQPLHNLHDPVAEAERWAGEAVERLARETAVTAVVLGFGLGYHVEALARRWSGRIVVVEPDLALLHTACGVRDLQSLWSRVELMVSTLDDATIDDLGRHVLLRHGPSWLRGQGGLRELAERIAGRSTARQVRLSIVVISPLSGGSYPITGYCARALAALGHDVHVLDLAPFAAGAEALPHFAPSGAGRQTVDRAFSRFLSAGIRTAVERLAPDLVLGMAQAPIDAALLSELGSLGCVRAFWFVEDHRLFPYWRDVVGGYDYFGVIQRGAFFDEAAAHCPGRVLYLPLAADPMVHRPLELSAAEQQEFGSPVAFVGAGYRNRRVALRCLLESGLKIWGSEWGGALPVGPAVQRNGARVSTEDSVRIFNATTINLNLHSSTYVDGIEPRGDFVNPRTFELAACGAFQLVDERALLPALFRPGEEVITFNEVGALPALVREWQARPADRARIASAARRRVLAEHTYEHRMQTLLESICARETERFRSRPRAATTADVAALEGGSPLATFLNGLPPETPFTLDGVVGAMQGREGDLHEAEGIMLFLHQFDDLYVKEHRA